MPKPQGDPQLEHGHTRIANELLEAVSRAPLSGGELKVVLAIMRFTYGWRRKQAPISASQIARATGLSLRHVKRLLGFLHAVGVVSQSRPGRRNVLGLNKRYSEWALWATSAQGDNIVPQSVTSPSPVEVTSLSPHIKKRKKLSLKKGASRVLGYLETALQRPLTGSERATVLQLQALDPTQQTSLLERLRGRV